ncbi:MFS transporter [Kitasatospora azatica]|uniref:MFS transporter n=1 Tax=Kitasatospora azatica TaxID=58347 RepID=UPI00068B028B|nr:MFS transporter [Kitasatospora azatica]
MTAPTDQRALARDAAPSALAAGGNRRAALILLVAVQFMLVLDSTIVAVAMPSLGTDLGFSQASLSWVTNAYVLLFGGFLMLGGRLADLTGRRKLFILSLVLFAVASAVGGLASSPAMVIIVRAVQGLASALAAPAALSLLMTVFPDDTAQGKTERNKALGVYGAVSGAGGAAGMILGGVLTDWFGWQAVFYVNVPIALIAAALAVKFLPAGESTVEEKRFDLGGALFVTAGLGLLVFSLVDADKAGWGSARTLGGIAGALVLLALFLVVESKHSQPLIPLGIFRRKVLPGANLVGGLIPMAMIPAIFFLTLYTQIVQGYSPLRSGLALVPLALAVVLAATNVGRVLPLLGLKGTTMLGTLLVAGGTFWASGINGGGFWLEQFGPEILAGLGGGTVWVSATVAATSSASEEEAGLASGLFNTSNQIGAALGLAVLATVAAAGTTSSTKSGHAVNTALTAGYSNALVGAAIIAVVATLAAAFMLPGKSAMRSGS